MAAACRLPPFLHAQACSLEQSKQGVHRSDIFVVRKARMSLAAFESTEASAADKTKAACLLFSLFASGGLVHVARLLAPAIDLNAGLHKRITDVIRVASLLPS